MPIRKKIDGRGRDGQQPRTMEPVVPGVTPRKRHRDDDGPPRYNVTVGERYFGTAGSRFEGCLMRDMGILADGAITLKPYYAEYDDLLYGEAASSDSVPLYEELRAAFRRRNRPGVSADNRARVDGKQRRFKTKALAQAAVTTETSEACEALMRRFNELLARGPQGLKVNGDADDYGAHCVSVAA